MTNQKEIETLAKKIWSENEDVATELANVIFGIRDGDYDEPEFEYPIFKKNRINGFVIKFTDLKEGTTVIPNSIRTVGNTYSNYVHHTDTDAWKDVPYDRKRGLYHGQPSYVWDNDDTHQKSIAFYDAINRCIFTSEGKCNGEVWGNYEAIPAEQIPDWMYMKYQTLEGI